MDLILVQVFRTAESVDRFQRDQSLKLLKFKLFIWNSLKFVNHSNLLGLIKIDFFLKIEEPTLELICFFAKLFLNLEKSI